MRKAVVLAMTAPLIAGPAGMALAFDGGTAPTSPTTAVQQAVSPAGDPTGTSQPAATTADPGTDSTAAPDSESDAKALDVAGVVGVGHTHAKAGPDGSEATGNALELGGSTPQVGTTGSKSTDGGKEQDSAIIDSGSTPLGQIQVAPSTAKTTKTDSGSSADATASLAHVLLGGGDGNPFLDLLVLGSQSHADWSSTESASNSSSDGVHLQAGQDASKKPDLDIILLHSATSSDNKADNTAYVASINGTQIIDQSQVGGQCNIPIPGLVTINCVEATGGVGTTAQQAADVVTANFEPDQLPDATVVGASGHAGQTGTPQVSTPGDTTQGSPQGGTQVEGTKTTQGGGLPFTGLNAMSLTGIGAALAGAGAAAMRLGRRRRSQAS